MLSLSLTRAAADDILEQAEWYELKGDARLAKRWEGSVYLSIYRLLRHPNSGALSTFKSADLRGIRRVHVPAFPKHLIFYRAENDQITILRVIHAARDLQSLF